MSVREFWLENSKGAKFTLTNKDKPVFFNDPSGLGFDAEFDTTTVGVNDTVESAKYVLKPIQGEIIFHASQTKQIYQDYFDFMRFISYNPLKLYYRPQNTQEKYFCVVRVARIEKSEIKSDARALRCPIEFKRESFWQKGEANVLLLKNVLAPGGKSYPLKRAYYYGQNMLANVSIMNNSICDTPFSIEVIGRCTDFQFQLYDEFGEQYGAGKIIGTYDYIFIDSDDLNEALILKIDDEEVENAFNMQDLSVGVNDKVAVTFLKLRPGKSTLKAIPGDSFNGIVNVRWSDYYVSI